MTSSMFFDESAEQTILCLSTGISLVIACFSLYGRWIVLPRLVRITGDACTPNFRKECLMTLAWMALATTLVTWPITFFLTNSNSSNYNSNSNSNANGIDSDDFHGPPRQQHLTAAATTSVPSSINFCETDFVHTPYIAEPANTVSSLFAYLPIAIVGIRLSSSSQRRYRLCYATIFMIGAGSAFLHTLLTAVAQGGDELPMLWYTAATSYCGFRFIFKTAATDQWIATAVASSALIATFVYLFHRANFIVFALMFDSYTLILIFSLVYMTLFFNWQKQLNGGGSGGGGAYFQQHVLYPLGQAAAWTAIAAIWTWVLEMLYCHESFFLWNRCLHPLWHFLTGLLATLVVQIVHAADGFADNDHQATYGYSSNTYHHGKMTAPIVRVAWYGAPFVIFQKDKTE